MSRPLSIALVIDRYDPGGGGAERWTHEHARRLIEAGHHVTIIARSIRSLPGGASARVIDCGPAALASRRVRFAAGVEHLLRSESFDIVHDLGDGWSGDVLMPYRGVRSYIFRQRSRLTRPILRWLRPVAYALLPRYRAFRTLERRQYTPDHSRHVVAVSDMVRRQLISAHRLEPACVRVIPVGVDLDRFCPQSDGTDRRRVRERLGWGSRTIYLTMADDPRTGGADRALAALAHLRGRGRDAGLIVAGGEGIERLRALAQHLGCLKDVVFVGECPDPVPYYRAADVLVAPTLYDPCPLETIEALACGLPVITTAHNGATELMRLPHDGVVLHDPMNVIELALAMLGYDEAGGVRPTRAPGPAHRRDDLCARRAYAAHLALYEEILRERPRVHARAGTHARA